MHPDKEIQLFMLSDHENCLLDKLQAKVNNFIMKYNKIQLSLCLENFH